MELISSSRCFFLSFQDPMVDGGLDHRPWAFGRTWLTYALLESSAI